MSRFDGYHFQDNFVVPEHGANFLPSLFFGNTSAYFSGVSAKRNETSAFTNRFSEVVDVVWWLCIGIHFDDRPSGIESFEQASPSLLYLL